MKLNVFHQMKLHKIYWSYMGMQASIFGACPKPGYIERVVTGRASGIKMRDDEGGSLISQNGVASSWITTETKMT